MSDQDENPIDASSFDWDENKRKANISKHNIDFIRAIEIFATDNIDVASKYTHEPRRKMTGLLGSRFVTVVYTIRGQTIRIISARPARDNERRTYRALYARGDP